MRRTSEADRRASIWSVPEDWQRWYLALFNIQVICLLSLVSWHEVSSAPVSAGPVDILVSVGSSMSGLILLVAADSILLTDVFKMLFTLISEKYLNRREKLGEQRGRAAGSAEERKKWLDWNARRVSAESRGEEFKEAPPAQPSENGTS